MSISAKNEILEAEIRTVRFEGEMLFIELSDERLLGLPFRRIKWLDWLAQATPQQRLRWTIEPHGYAVWWDELDDGFELVHALSPQELPHKTGQELSQPHWVAA
ncbi:MAG: DUF2442 domain-containing protein [Chloroflexi bacterium]|nr:DUF2442 domain-containing protein [Chloroflexota bacterium]